MSGWTNEDAHGNAPLFALAQVQKAPTASNMGAAASGKLGVSTDAHGKR